MIVGIFVVIVVCVFVGEFLNVMYVLGVLFMLYCCNFLRYGFGFGFDRAYFVSMTSRLFLKYFFSFNCVSIVFVFVFGVFVMIIVFMLCVLYVFNSVCNFFVGCNVFRVNVSRKFVFFVFVIVLCFLVFLFGYSFVNIFVFDFFVMFFLKYLCVSGVRSMFVCCKSLLNMIKCIGLLFVIVLFKLNSVVCNCGVGCIIGVFCVVGVVCVLFVLCIVVV